MTFLRALHAAFVDARIEKGSMTVPEALSPAGIELEQAFCGVVVVLATGLVVLTVLGTLHVDLC